MAKIAVGRFLKFCAEPDAQVLNEFRILSFSSNISPNPRHTRSSVYKVKTLKYAVDDDSEDESM